MRSQVDWSEQYAIHVEDDGGGFGCTASVLAVA